jgi:hypothetical protein
MLGIPTTITHQAASSEKFRPSLILPLQTHRSIAPYAYPFSFLFKIFL